MTSDHSDREYQPIPCAEYSRYELAILRQDALLVCWNGARGVTRLETLLPRDLRTRTHAEYLIAHNGSGAIRVIRLDRIRRARSRAETAELPATAG